MVDIVCSYLQKVAELENSVENDTELAFLSREAQRQLHHLHLQMKDVAEKRREFEREHSETLLELKQKQGEGKYLHKSQGTDREKNQQLIEVLESKLREMEKKCELQSVRHEELVLEMDTLRRSLTNRQWSPSSNQTENSKMNTRSTPCGDLPRGSSVSIGNACNSINSINVSNTPLPSARGGLLSSSSTSTSTTTTCPSPSSSNSCSFKNPSSSSAGWHPLPLPRTSTNCGSGSSMTASVRSTLPAPPITDANQQIERIMAKIEQDNRVLAELDRTRATFGLSGNDSSHNDCSSNGTKLPADPSPLLLPIRTGEITRTTSSSKPTDAATDKQATVAITATSTVVTGTINDPTVPSASAPVPALAPVTLTTTAAPPPTTTAAAPPISISFSDCAHAPSLFITAPSLDSELESGDVLDIPGKGLVKVYMARYSYDPLQHSPNENPEAELAVNAGDFILVRGEMDEDGFLEGELLDGRKGLVPSNFVERITGDDLVEIQHSVLGIPDSVFSRHNHNDDSVLIDGIGLEVEDIDAMDEEFLLEQAGEEPVPPPQKLTLERQLNKSILISWSPPEANASTVEAYNIYVDGDLRSTIQSNERCRALIEGVQSLGPHRVSVRSVTPNRRMSMDAACTMIIGRDVPVAPACVRATNITATSAVISWLPSNSTHQHVVCVNNVEVRVVKPGVYRHTITGLAPNTTYRVTVRVKGPKSKPEEKSGRGAERIATCVDFRTLPKGLPDPPLDVQVEAGPQDGTWLVTWQPVKGTILDSAVTGYVVFADGRKITDVDSPTGDHALIELNRLQGSIPKAVTVRTKCLENLSQDSSSAPIPADLLKSARVTARMARGEDNYEEGSEKSELSDIVEESGTGFNGKDRTDAGDKRNMDHEQSERAWRGEKPRDEGTKSGSGNKEKSRSMRGTPGREHHHQHRHHQEQHTGGGGGSGRVHRRQDSMGQMIIEPDENLSDKEIYPPVHITIPAIEITKDSASEECNSLDFSDEDYDVSPRTGSQGQRGAPSGGPMASKGSKQQGRMEPKARGLPRDDVSDYADHGARYHHHHHHRAVDDTYRGAMAPRRTSVGPSPTGPRKVHPQTRLFVALFDYDPKTMSPNPDVTEELPFREGQVIKIFGDKDPDGFYWGEVNGRQGFVPCNMVSQLHGDDVVGPHGRRGAVPPPARTAEMSRRSRSERWNSSFKGMPLKKMVAMYDYDPQELSPNVDSEMELSFSTGDIIHVYGDMDEDGFFVAEINGVRGLVPSNFLTEAPHEYPVDHPSARGMGYPPPTHQTSPQQRGKIPMGHDGRTTQKGGHDSRERERKPPPQDQKYGQTVRSGGQRW